MKTITAVFLTAFAALIFAACGAPPANNDAANTNTNTTKPAPAAPTADALLALDKQANDAYFKGDAKYFETFLSDKYGSSEGGKHHAKADTLKFIAGVKCDMKTWSIDEPQMSTIDADTAVLTYKGTYDGTCNDGAGGKSTKIPSPMRAATVFVRNGDKWQAAWHNETAIMEPKKDDKAADKTAVSDATKPDAKAESKKEEPKAEVKKEEPKKDEAKKEEPKKDDKAAASDTATAEVKPDANTDALVKLELSGWEAWKNHDAKALDAMAAKNLAFVNPGGMWLGTRAEVLKEWEGTGCKDIKNVGVKDGFGWALSPTVEILTFSATADGTCDGMKNGAMNGASVYVKEGDTWKVAFAFLSPAGKL